LSLSCANVGTAVMLTNTAANQARIMRPSDTRCFAMIDPFRFNALAVETSAVEALAASLTSWRLA
jgi:hypothetical protein